MSDEPNRQDLEDRVEQLESTISKMLPSRRDALKLGGAALVGGAAMSGAASAQPGDDDGEAGVIGTDNAPVDIEASDIEVDDLIVNQTATGVAQDLQGCRVFLGSSQNLPAGTRKKIEFDSIVYDSDANFDTSTHNFTCPKTGIYAVNVQAAFNGGSTQEERELIIGSGSNPFPSGEGALVEQHNTNSAETFIASTILKYSQSETIAGYVANKDNSDSLLSGNNNFATHMEVVFLGSL